MSYDDLHPLERLAGAGAGAGGADFGIPGGKASPI